MLRKLFSKPPAETPALAPHTFRRDIEFALVLVENPSDAQVEWTLGAVTESLPDYGGLVLQTMGSMVLVVFSGMVGTGPAPRRQAFADDTVARYRGLVRVLHGRSSALVGDFGGTRRSYTAIPDQQAQILQALLQLKPGQVGEWGQQLAAAAT